MKTLLVLSVLFVAVLSGAWLYSAEVQKKFLGHDSTGSVDATALIEVEKMRNLTESQIDKSLGFFLLGSTTLFDEQKRDKQTLADTIVQFEKQHNLPKVAEILRRIETLSKQQEEIFDQAMDFRSKKTESKIVGQFYRSKTASLKEQIGKSLDEIVQLHNAELARLRAQGKDAAFEAQVLIPRGMTIFISLLSILFVGMVLLVIRMLNERSRQTADRSRLYDEAKKAVQSRDEVLAALSQDLKEPLADLSQASAGNELIHSHVSVIEGLIKDILDQTKSEAGTMTLRLDQLGIDAILDDTRMILQPIAKKKDIRLEFNSVNPPALAFMDRERVMRVLSNLVGNAIKFSPSNSKVIVKVKSDQQFVFVSVKDSGPGIPEKQLPHIFDHFWQARKTAEQGAGIGLAIVKTIVEAHGGTVTVESHVGHGSTFTFSLPRRRPAGANIGRPLAQNVRQTSPQSQASNEMRW